MVCSKLFCQVHKRLNEIFISGQDIQFDEKSVLACVELFQYS